MRRSHLQKKRFAENKNTLKQTWNYNKVLLNTPFSRIVTFGRQKNVDSKKFSVIMKIIEIMKFSCGKSRDRRVVDANLNYSLRRPKHARCMLMRELALHVYSRAVGHAYVAGRDKDRARVAALCDALMQGPMAKIVRETVLEPMDELLDKAKAEHAGKAAATKVDFFTLARGED